MAMTLARVRHGGHAVGLRLAQTLRSGGWRRDCRLGKSVFFNRDRLLHLFDLNCESSVRTRDSPPKRGLYPTLRTIICKLYLRGISSDRRLRVALHPQQQSGLFVKIKFYWQLAFPHAQHDIGLLAIERFPFLYSQFPEDLLEISGEEEFLVQLRGIQF